VTDGDVRSPVTGSGGMTQVVVTDGVTKKATGDAERIRATVVAGMPVTSRMNDGARRGRSKKREA